MGSPGKSRETGILPHIRLRVRCLHRDCVFRYAMGRFRRDPLRATTCGRTISALVYGWGNRWSAKDEYLSACLLRACETRGDILECGSGLTTILLGVIAERSGRLVWSLEHDMAFAGRVRKCLERYRIKSVRLCVSTLKNYGEFAWYEPPREAMTGAFALVVCDGPPGRTHGGRYGLLPVMRDTLEPGAVILLDDAEREGERAIARRWAAEFGTSYALRGSVKPYVEICLSGAGKQAVLPVPETPHPDMRGLSV